MFYCGCRNPGHLEKVLLLHAPILSPNEAFLGIGARALVARQTDRQTECFNLVSTLEEFFFFFFFLEHYSTLYESSILWIFFLFFFLTVLNFLQNSYDDVIIIVCANVKIHQIFFDSVHLTVATNSQNWNSSLLRYIIHEMIHLSLSRISETNEIGNEIVGYNSWNTYSFKTTHVSIPIPRQLIGYYCEIYSQFFKIQVFLESFPLIDTYRK